MHYRPSFAYNQAMNASAERLQQVAPTEQVTFDGILRHIPEVIQLAKLEVDSSGLATTPEGKFAATYLLATRKLLRPVLHDLQAIGPDFLLPIGGAEYNPERSIDEIGTIVAERLAAQTHDIPDLWIRSEESARWQNMDADGRSVQDGQIFAVIDPLDMTSSIQKKDRVQTTGIAVYDREGNLKSVGIASLVDHGFVFLENRDGTMHVFPDKHEQAYQTDVLPSPLRAATLTRRMHQMRQLELFAGQHAIWAQDCTSGYSVLSLLNGSIDTVLDPFKGNPWYEVVIWIQAAQQLGLTVSDREGNPIDFSAAVRRMIERHDGDTFRIPFIVSRTPQIHEKTLRLLRPKEAPPA